MNKTVEAFEKVENRIKDIDISRAELAKMIDHTELSPYKTTTIIDELCEEANSHGFHSVCVNPYYTEFCSKKLQGKGIDVDTVVGFPLGQNTPETKASEAEEAIENGTNEIDMVMNIAAFREKKYDWVKGEIKTVLEVAQGKTLKVIIESGFLTYEEVEKASQLIEEAGADFVKNATGFGPCGANIPHIYLMRRAVGDEMGVKAAGGIHNFGDASLMIAAGANRIGASAGVEIVQSYDDKSPEELLNNVDICNFCPSEMLSREDIPFSLYRYYEEKCEDCPYIGKE